MPVFFFKSKNEKISACHGSNQEIIKYFDAVFIGLTATPTDVIEHNTFELFDCENGLPTFAYSYEEAVNHDPPYLCDFQVMKIQTKFQLDGISKRTISLEDQKKLLLTGEEVAEIDFKGSDLEKKVINSDTNRLIIQEFMKESIKSSEGTIPGKTIFFCMSIPHARRMEEMFNKMYPEFNGELAKVIVSDDDRVYEKGGLLDQFKNSDMPRVAFSVGMLDTGVDVREIVNLVFAKPVYSYTRFWQMIGRGTRLLEQDKLKKWCLKKDKFLILDCWDNFEYFKEKPKGKENIPSEPLPVSFFDLRLKKIEKAIAQENHNILSNELDKLKEQLDSLPEKSIEVKDHVSKINKLRNSDFWEEPTVQQIEQIRTDIKPLFKTVTQTNFKEMQFEKDVLEISLSLMDNNSKRLSRYKEKLLEKVQQFPLSINTVAREKKLIEAVQTEKFWKNVTEKDLSEIVQKLAPFTKHIDETGRIKNNKPAEFNFKDVVKAKEYVEFGPEMESVSITKYREMVENKINELLKSNSILMKIKKHEIVNEDDAVLLAEQLYNEHPNITINLLRRVYKNRKAKFIQFIKHILGVEKLKSFPEKVTETIDMFLKEHNYLNQRQIDFINLLRKYIIEHENITKKNLIESPFTGVHPKGIRGVFNQDEINEILQITKELVA